MRVVPRANMVHTHADPTEIERTRLLTPRDLREQKVARVQLKTGGRRGRTSAFCLAYESFAGSEYEGIPTSRICIWPSPP